LKTGILLVNLGTPDSPSTTDVRKYLREFLMDPRVIDIPFISRWLLVNLIITTFRAPKSALLYSKVWRKDGTSPLLYYSIRQKELLQQLLGNEYQVELGMRYQSPSIESALIKFKKPLFKKIIVFPLFPQYASASNGSVVEKVMEIVQKWEAIPEIKFTGGFGNDENFIEAFAEVGKKYNHAAYDHVLFSFHGLPERQIKKADCNDYCFKENCCSSLNENNALCYRAQCFSTARLLAEELNIPEEKYTICFQSRLGKDPWIKPYSDIIIKERADAGNKKLLVFAPAFVSDCLETLYEIKVEYEELFKKHGGEKLDMVESLNDSPKWIQAMERVLGLGF
jgi:protoporphyrin/coproporphyrin ferrochelatase